MRLFADSVTETELRDIEDLLQFWTERQPVILPPPGTQFGSGPTLAAGAGALALTGSPRLTAMIVGARAATARLLMTKSGRAALRNLISKDQPINLTEIMSLAIMQGGRQVLGPDPLATSMRLQQRFRQPRFTAP